MAVAVLSTLMLAGCVDGPADPFEHGSVDPMSGDDFAGEYVCATISSEYLVKLCNGGVPPLGLRPDGTYTVGDEEGRYLIRGGSILFYGEYEKYNPSMIFMDGGDAVIVLTVTGNDVEPTEIRFERDGDEPIETETSTEPPSNDVDPSLAGAYVCVGRTDWQGAQECYQPDAIELNPDGTWSMGRTDHPDTGTWTSQGKNLIFEPLPFGDDPWAVTFVDKNTFEIAVDDGEDTRYLYERPDPSAAIDAGLVGLWICETVQTDRGKDDCGQSAGKFELRDDGRWIAGSEDGHWKSTSERIYFIQDEYRDHFGPSVLGRAYLEGRTTIRFEGHSTIYWYTHT